MKRMPINTAGCIGIVCNILIVYSAIAAPARNDTSVTTCYGIEALKVCKGTSCTEKPCTDKTLCLRHPTPQCVLYSGLTKSCLDEKTRKITATVDEPPTPITIAAPCPASTPYCHQGTCQAAKLVCADLDFSTPVQSSESGLVLQADDPSIWDPNVVTLSGGGKEIDSCKTEGWKFLIERVCVGGAVKSLQFDCSSVNATCQKGACVKSSLTPIPWLLKIITLFPLYDLCLELSGFQLVYPFDTDNNGTADSCAPVRGDFCQSANPQKQYPDATLYGYQGVWHAGFCLPENPNHVLHVICGADGTWTTDITPCEDDNPCQSGACQLCNDPDNDAGSLQPDDDGLGPQATTTSKTPGGLGNSLTDTCHVGYSGRAAWEYYCTADDKISGQLQWCPKGTACTETQDANGMQLTCVPVQCSDTDGKSTDTAGTVTLIDSSGTKIYSVSDECTMPEGATSYVEYYCSSDNATIESETYSCNTNEVCKLDTEKNPYCAPQVALISCSDSDGGKSPVFGKITLQYSDGSEKKIPDGCAAADALHEGYCTPDTLKGYAFETTYCPIAHICKKYEKDGQLIVACVPNCQDTDAGNLPGTFGTVTDFKNVPYPDFCEGDVVKQYQCDPATDEKMEVTPPAPCPKGCANGACLQ